MCSTNSLVPMVDLRIIEKCQSTLIGGHTKACSIANEVRCGQIYTYVNLLVLYDSSIVRLQLVA